MLVAQWRIKLRNFQWEKNIEIKDAGLMAASVVLLVEVTGFICAALNWTIFACTPFCCFFIVPGLPWIWSSVGALHCASHLRTLLPAYYTKRNRLFIGSLCFLSTEFCLWSFLPWYTAETVKTTIMPQSDQSCRLQDWSWICVSLQWKACDCLFTGLLTLY